MATVPNCAGNTYEQATNRLRSRGFTRTQRRFEATSGRARHGLCTRTAPPSGTTSARPASVTVSIFIGVYSTSVPNVVGSTEASARSRIRSAGFRVTVSYRETTSSQVGKVIAQSPAAGTKRDIGRPVAITVGVRTNVTVPNVVGLAQAAAAAAIGRAGLAINARHRATSDRSQDGRVLSQSPPAGSTVAKGSRVNIVVGQYTAPPATSTVPNVAGQTQAAATAALTSDDQPRTRPPQRPGQPTPRPAPPQQDSPGFFPDSLHPQKPPGQRSEAERDALSVLGKPRQPHETQYRIQLLQPGQASRHAARA